jgi:hypothetical protein
MKLTRRTCSVPSAAPNCRAIFSRTGLDIKVVEVQLLDGVHPMTDKPEVPMVQRTKAALQSAEGKTINTWKYGKDGIVFYFLDGTNLEIDITYDREIVGVQNEPYLMAHFGRKKR